MTITQETVNLLYSIKYNSPTYGLHSFKYEGPRMWNKLNLSFRSAGSAQQFTDCSNGMEVEVCECDTLTVFYVCCNVFRIPCAFITSFHFTLTV